MRAALVAVTLALFSVAASAAACDMPARLTDDTTVGADRDALRSAENAGPEQMAQLKRQRLIWTAPTGTAVCMLTPGNNLNYIAEVRFADGTVGVVSDRKLRRIGWGDHQ